MVIILHANFYLHARSAKYFLWKLIANYFTLRWNTYSLHIAKIYYYTISVDKLDGHFIVCKGKCCSGVCKGICCKQIFLNLVVFTKVLIENKYSNNKLISNQVCFEC